MNFSDKVIEINSTEEFYDAIKNNTIQKGDLMYFSALNDEHNGLYHATIISEVDKTMIYYAAHTNPWALQKLTYFLDGTEGHKVYILKISQGIIMKRIQKKYLL